MKKKNYFSVKSLCLALMIGGGSLILPSCCKDYDKEINPIKAELAALKATDVNALIGSAKADLTKAFTVKSKELNDRIAQLELKLKDQTGVSSEQIEKIKKDLADNYVLKSTLEAFKRSAESKLTMLEASVRKNAEDIIKILGEVNGIKQTATKLGLRVDDLERKYNQLSSTLDTKYQELLNKIGEVKSELDGRIKTLQGQLDALKGNAQASDILKKIQANAQAIETLKSDLQKKYDDLNKLISDNKVDITTLQNNLSDLQKNLDQKFKDINDQLKKLGLDAITFATRLTTLTFIPQFTYQSTNVAYAQFLLDNCEDVTGYTNLRFRVYPQNVDEATIDKDNLKVYVEETTELRNANEPAKLKAEFVKLEEGILTVKVSTKDVDKLVYINAEVNYSRALSDAQSHKLYVEKYFKKPEAPVNGGPVPQAAPAPSSSLVTLYNPFAPASNANMRSVGTKLTQISITVPLKDSALEVNSDYMPLISEAYSYRDIYFNIPVRTNNVVSSQYLPSYTLDEAKNKPSIIDIAYNESLDLKEIIMPYLRTLPVDMDMHNLEMSFDIKEGLWEGAKNIVYTKTSNDGTQKTDQQKFIKIDGSIVTPTAYDGTPNNKSAIDKTPIIHVVMHQKGAKPTVCNTVRSFFVKLNIKAEARQWIEKEVKEPFVLKGDVKPAPCGVNLPLKREISVEEAFNKILKELNISAEQFGSFELIPIDEENKVNAGQVYMNDYAKVDPAVSLITWAINRSNLYPFVGKKLYRTVEFVSQALAIKVKLHFETEKPVIGEVINFDLVKQLSFWNPAKTITYINPNKPGDTPQVEYIMDLRNPFKNQLINGNTTFLFPDKAAQAYDYSFHFSKAGVNKVKAGAKTYTITLADNDRTVMADGDRILSIVTSTDGMYAKFTTEGVSGSGLEKLKSLVSSEEFAMLVQIRATACGNISSIDKDSPIKVNVGGEKDYFELQFVPAVKVRVPKATLYDLGDSAETPRVSKYVFQDDKKNNTLVFVDFADFVIKPADYGFYGITPTTTELDVAHATFNDGPMPATIKLTWDGASQTLTYQNNGNLLKTAATLAIPVKNQYKFGSFKQRINVTVEPKAKPSK